MSDAGRETTPQVVCPRFCAGTIRWGNVRAGAYVYCDHNGGWQPLRHPSDAVSPPARKTTCRDCGKPLQDSDECRASGLCLLCLNGPVPTDRQTTAGTRAIRDALAVLINRAHLHEEGKRRLTEEEFGLLDDVARWWEANRG